MQASPASLHRKLWVNRLAESLSAWKTWYSVLALIAFLFASQIALLPQLAESLVPHEHIQNILQNASVPLQFIGFSILSLIFIRLFAKKWPTVEDLGLKPRITLQELVLILVVFLLSHAFFILISTGIDSSTQAKQLFEELGLKQGLAYSLPLVFSSVILAPVCEELLYRGVMLRSIHDGLARKGFVILAPALSLAAASLFFALPHVADSLLGRMSLAYIVTGLAFGFIYIRTGSLTAAMLSHALQSCYAFGNILIYGRGDSAVSPLVYLLVFGCPLWTYLSARTLWLLLPKTHQPA